MSQLFANNFTTTLSSSLGGSTSSVSATLTSEAGLPDLGTTGDGIYSVATLSHSTQSDVEIIRLEYNATGTTYVVTRAQEGTSALAWPSGTQVEIRITASPLNKLSPHADLPAVVRKNNNVFSCFNSTLTSSSLIGLLNWNGSNLMSRDLNWHKIIGEPNTITVDDKIGGLLTGDMLVTAYASVSGTTRSLCGYVVEVQIKKPTTVVNPVIGTIYRSSSTDTSGYRSYYFEGDVRHAIRAKGYLELENPPTGGIREYVSGYHYLPSTDRTYVKCITYAGVALTSSSVSVVDSLWYGVSTGGYKAFSNTIMHSRYMGSTLTYHRARILVDLGLHHDDLEIRIMGKKSTTSSVNVSSISIQPESSFYVSRG